METFFDTIGSVRKTDIIILLSATIPIFAIYLIFTLVYFLVIDKKLHKKEDGGYYESHGLSRFCLGGIFLMFGLIIFDMIMEFISAYSVNFINPDIMSEEVVTFLNQSLIFNGMCKVFKSVPTDILINFTILCTAVYTSTEGVIASLRTLNVAEGLSVELPAVKRKRLAIMFAMWAYLAIISTLYTFLIGSDTVKFDLANVYISLGLTLVILFLAERSPSLLKDKSLQTKIHKSANNVIHEKVESGNDATDVTKAGILQNTIGDKVELDKLESTIANFNKKPDELSEEL